MEVQGESKHVVDAVHPGDLEQLQQRALALLLALVNNGVITAQHHGVPSSLVGLRRPRVQLALTRLHVRLVKLLQDTKRENRVRGKPNRSSTNYLTRCVF